MIDQTDLVSRKLERQLQEIGASLAENYYKREMEGTKYTSGWDESFRVHVPSVGDVGLGPKGELSLKYNSASNEYWAGHSSSLEKRVELEKFLHHPKIRMGAPTSWWDVVQRNVFHNPRENVSAHVGGVMDEELRLKSDWITEDLPKLLKTSGVRNIHLIDDVTGHTTTVNRKEAVRVFEHAFKDEDYQDKAQAALWEHQVKITPLMHNTEEAMKTATPEEVPWLEMKIYKFEQEMGLSVRDFALRQFAADLDGSRVYIARQDLEGNFEVPEQPDELRKYNLSIDLQNQGAIVTTLEAPRHGLSFAELQERADLQREVEALKQSFNNDFDAIFAREQALSTRPKEEVREARNELAAALRSVRSEVEAFVDILSLSERAQIGLDLERRMITTEVINTDTALGRHLQEDAYLSSELQTLTDQVLVYQRAEKEKTQGRPQEGEVARLEEKIAQLRATQLQHSREVVPLDDLDPKLRERYELSLAAQKQTVEVHDSLEQYFRQWRLDRGVLSLEKRNPAQELSRQELAEQLKSIYEQHGKNDPSVEEETSAKILPPLNAEQRKKFSQNMHVLTYEVIGTVILNILPAASSAVDTTLAIRDANTMVQSRKKAKDPEVTPLERLEAQWEAKMAKVHVVQQVVSAGAALIPLVGIPATMAMGLANLVYDCVEGSKLEKVRDNLRDIEEPPVWRKPSERRPAPHPKPDAPDDELTALLKKQEARGFVSAFSTEKWKEFFHDFHGTKETAEKPSEGVKIGG